MNLRKYQQECLDAIEEAGDGRWLCQLATGLGKTVIFANIPLRGRELILSHRTELVHQPLKYFTCPTAVEMADERAANSTAPVVSASVQTMTRRMTQYDPATFDTIIVDEAHHASADSYRKILEYFEPKRIIGFTATPNRADGVGLECVFEKILFQKDLRWGIEHGYLSPITCKRLDIGYDLAGVAVRMGDYAASDLERVLNIDRCNDAIAEAVANIVETPCLIFAVDVAHAHAIAAAINKTMWNPACPKGVARAVSGQSKDRDELVEQYKAGKIPVLVNCALFTEGTDLPNTRTVMIARPTKSTTLYTQMVGRGTRLAPGKERCLLVDCVGVSNKPLCTAPSLLGLDPKDVPQKYRKDIEGDLLLDIPNLVATRADTPESWINMVHIVDLWGRENHYTLHDVRWNKSPDGSMFVCYPNEDNTRKKWIRVTAPDSLGNAVLLTDHGDKLVSNAQECYDTAYDMLRSTAGYCAPLWRTSLSSRWGNQPAGEKQIEFVEKLARKKKVDVSGVLPNLTKGQASSLIEQLLER